MTNARRKGKWSAAARARHSARMKRRWADPCLRALHLAGIRAAAKDPEILARRRAGQARPEVRARMGENTRRRHAERRQRLGIPDGMTIKEYQASVRRAARAARTWTPKPKAETPAPPPLAIEPPRKQRSSLRIVKERIEAMPTSDAQVHQRIAARAHKYIKFANNMVIHIHTPPPNPELHGWQKILCGRLG